MNNNLRPFLAFLTIVVLTGAAFWGILTFASRYNNRLATPDPIAQVEERSPRNEPEEEPAPQKETPAPTPTTPAPIPEKTQEETPKPQPVPSQPATPAPSTSAPVAPPIVTAGAVPATGLGSNLLLTSIFVMFATFLAILLRSQLLHIRTNR